LYYIFYENQELQFNQPQAPVQINNSKDALVIQDILTAQTKSKIELKPNHVLNLIWADEGIK